MEHMRMDPKHQFAAQYVLSRAAAERREREILASSSLGIKDWRVLSHTLTLMPAVVATDLRQLCKPTDEHVLIWRPCAVQEPVWECWEVRLEDHKICNNHQCARRRRPIRIAVAATEDYRRPVVNLVRYDTCSTSTTTYKRPSSI